MQEDYANTIPQMVEDVRAGRTPRRKFMKALTALGISAADVSMVSSAATQPLTSLKLAPMSPLDAQPTQNLQLHQQHLAHQSQGDTGASQHTMVEDSMHSETLVGRAAIMARKGVGIGAIPNLKTEVPHRIPHGSQVVAEWSARVLTPAIFLDYPPLIVPFPFAV